MLEQFNEAAKEVARAENELDQQVVELVEKRYGRSVDFLTVKEMADIAARADEGPETEAACDEILGLEDKARGIAEQLKEEIGENLELIEKLDGRNRKLYLRLIGGPSGTYHSNIVELDNGPMVNPATPGASAPAVLGGNIFTVGIRDLMYVHRHPPEEWIVPPPMIFPDQGPPSARAFIETFPWQDLGKTAIGGALLYMIGRAAAPVVLTPNAVLPMTTCPHCQRDEVY